MLVGVAAMVTMMTLVVITVDDSAVLDEGAITVEVRSLTVDVGSITVDIGSITVDVGLTTVDGIIVDVGPTINRNKTAEITIDIMS